jgi:RNA polymerase sigma-70 factor (ECF subfamily)
VTGALADEAALLLNIPAVASTSRWRGVAMAEFPAEQLILVARARLGDERAFERLVHVYTPRLIWFVRKLGLTEGEADDVVQETWLVAWSKLRCLRKMAVFRGWLYGIARNKSLQHLDKAREVPADDLDVAAEIPDQVFFDRYLPYLDRGLDRISAIHREVLALRFLEEMTYVELAEATGVPVGTVKSRLHNGKLALRRELEAIADD